MNLLFSLILLIPFCAYSGNPASPHENLQDERDNTRLIIATMANAAVSSGTLLVLNQMWYKDYPRSSFQFHNDAKDWKQMDKLGHATSAYHFSRLSSKSFLWAVSDRKLAAWAGTASGLLLISTVEMLDGYSADWGFSMADFSANLIGAGSFLFQELKWHEQKIIWKYSYSPSGIAKYRPDLLGSSWQESLIKDYNGQTYWISANLHALFNLSTPTWLNLAIGHGAMGMLGSRHNPSYHKGIILPEMKRYRSWYLAPDINLSGIETQSAFWNSVLSILNFLKVPSPALEYSTHGKWQLHWLLF